MSPSDKAIREDPTRCWLPDPWLDALIIPFTDTNKPEMSPEMSVDDPSQSNSQDWQATDAPSPSGSARSDIDAEDEKTNDGDAPTQPVQKRRRVTRACDECRRKKIKCDGKQPCTHCSVYSYGA